MREPDVDAIIGERSVHPHFIGAQELYIKKIGRSKCTHLHIDN